MESISLIATFLLACAALNWVLGDPSSWAAGKGECCDTTNYQLQLVAIVLVLGYFSPLWADTGLQSGNQAWNQSLSTLQVPGMEGCDAFFAKTQQSLMGKGEWGLQDEQLCGWLGQPTNASYAF